jgi:hypothetical protein
MTKKKISIKELVHAATHMGRPFSPSPPMIPPDAPTESAPSVSPVPDEDWTITQVASHMGLSYQTARNQMLQGIFGMSKFDAPTRCLTVSANQVKRVRTMRMKKKSKKSSRNTRKKGRK